MSKVLQTSYAKWLCAYVFVVIFFLAKFILTTQSAEAVTFRLPLSSDTSVHYYYDHDSSSEILDWQCGTKTYNGHRGTDFSGGPRGGNIYAAAEGTLDYKIDGFGDGFIGSTDGGGFGNYVRLDHGNGLKTYYAHMTSGSVTSKSISSNISCSEQIGGVGTSGSSSGLHLHFEPRLNGEGFDPYAGSCSESTSWWVDQGTDSPSTTCENSSNTSFWTGNGSIINYHGRLLSQDAGTDWPYGIEKDVTMLHTSSGNPVGFFQWQVNTSGCGNLKIDAPTLSSDEKKVDITVGSWNTRENDKTFTNVQLPFTLGSSNIGTLNNGDWRVIAVAWKSNVSKDARLDVECTNETPTSASSSAGNSVILEGEYKWNGNGSVISHMFRSLANRSSTSSDVDWPYGAFKDVAKVHPSSEKPVVFFQWQVWDSGCKQLKLDAPDLNSDEKHVNIEVKLWDQTSPQKVFSDVTLPFTIGASNIGFSMSDGQWLVIKIEFLNPVSNPSRVEASCPGF